MCEGIVGECIGVCVWCRTSESRFCSAFCQSFHASSSIGCTIRYVLPLVVISLAEYLFSTCNVTSSISPTKDMGMQGPSMSVTMCRCDKRGEVLACKAVVCAAWVTRGQALCTEGFAHVHRCSVRVKYWAHMLAYMHISTKSIQIYFGIFFDFILVLLSFHCSHTIPIFFQFFPYFSCHSIHFKSLSL